MAWEDVYGRGEAPAGVLAFVPETAVLDGADATVAFSHKVLWAILRNTGAVALRIANSAAGIAAGVSFPVAIGDSISLSAIGSTRQVSIGAPSGGGDGEFALMCALDRQEVLAAHPALTAANGFPAYDGTDADGIVPGV